MIDKEPRFKLQGTGSLSDGRETTSPLRVILGSQSKWRQQSLRDWGYEFEAMPPDIDEKQTRRDDPQELTMALAHAKADALMSRIHEPALVVTCDQVAVCNNRILEKPRNVPELREFLRGYAQYPVVLVASVVVTNTQTKQRWEGSDFAKVYFKPIPEKVIDQLASHNELLECSGGFDIDDPLLRDYVARIEGEREVIIGLPKNLTETLIKKAATDI
jgi:septum formation protein